MLAVRVGELTMQQFSWLCVKIGKLKNQTNQACHQIMKINIYDWKLFFQMFIIYVASAVSKKNSVHLGGIVNLSTTISDLNLILAIFWNKRSS